MTEISPRLGARVMALIDDLARHTDEPGRLTRLYLSPAHRATADAVLGLMRAAGLSARIDAAGTVVGRVEGREPGLPALVLGSHIDSVVDAGRYDGPLGVAAALVVAEELRGAALPFALEVVAFGDEENVRFPTSLSTSKAWAGQYRSEWLEGRDAAGLTLREALVTFGGDPDGIPALARRPEAVAGYLEVHIEQGPALEAAVQPVGVVSAIAGLTRARCTVTGEANHAGTVPMGMRRDALAAAAEMTLAVERLSEGMPGTVATVGALAVVPGAVNVIAGQVDFSLDVRSPVDPDRHGLFAAIQAECRAIAGRRGVGFTSETFMDNPAVGLDPGLQAALDRAARDLGFAPLRLPSGATHDAVAMAALGPSAMLFVRCRGGISHNPAESITLEDADAATRVLLGTVRDLAGLPH
ncbi:MULTISPECIES: allantoate amidohydrolase [Methylobacterium]|jgi:allantoate deiminase|uniref:allantoate amidohydrolase n=1 Tax=Methylobacterium TaxID=407 RepID=UPI0008E5066C|nr:MULTISPECIES: allantoate amidohydrolase [Methylobacterium]MBZ6411615.1 allantoate amidohydrolase [Methylobacterium sp.]MBK3398317.1 allantoate amidohydrolase [Methylobacterium ajmalii]MBK3406753.1 allantoate amidohydrolase [Methylobacterium ajmalii]MBK3424183.1 allantoate amidohydrolase [Methylobacterium ajmalii]SFE41016.1 allantoate deiminase [Methylobacterium sp. yr596]